MQMLLLINDELKIHAQLVKAEIRKIYGKVLKPSPLSFPKTTTLGFIDFFSENLDDLRTCRADLIASVKNETETVRSELIFLRSFLGKTLKHRKKDEEFEDLENRAVAAAYEAECVIDLVAAGDGPFWYHVLWLSDVIEKLKHLRTEATDIYDAKMCEKTVHTIAKTSNHELSRDYQFVDEEVVGFKDEAEKVIDRLQRGSKELDVVSIIGLPGLGKTTLARKIYNDPSIITHFHVCLWCCVSQLFERRNVLLDILGNGIVLLNDKVREMSIDDLAEVLYRNLKGRRYLIVLDDIWNPQAWHDLRNSFPDDHNGSRIVFTSRVHDFALLAKPGGSPHHLRLFTEEESWELFQKKVFQQKICPPELCNVGKKIAKECRGLPLSVVLVAGLLRKITMTEDHWNEIAESLSKRIAGEGGKALDTLEMSYRHLPGHLKPCFLYSGMFPEDREIPARILIWLWIAEGFARETEMKALEDVAEGFLMDLIGRSLVMVSKTRSNGGVKTCQIHDLLREFCVEKAKQENFLMLLKGDELNFRHYNDLENNLNLENAYPLNLHQKRICISSHAEYLNRWRPSSRDARSLLMLATDEVQVCLSMYSYYADVSFIAHTLKLLRVLDLWNIRVGKFPKGIEMLVHLKYIAIQGSVNLIPSSIGNLWRLETFLLKGLDGVELPDTLWKMASLRHVCIYGTPNFKLPDIGHEHSLQLGNLKTLATPSLRFGNDTMEMILRRLPSLQKLSCMFLDSWDSSRCCNRLPELDFLHKLETVKVFPFGGMKCPYEFNLPLNLQKLTLVEFVLSRTAISKIGKLPNLEVLKLYGPAFQGKEWVVADGEFLNLKFLELDSVNIVFWNASDYPFPSLQRLLLKECWQLEEVPSSLGDITTLEMIEVHWCSCSAEKSVKQIQEEQNEMGNYGLKVIIKPLWMY